MLIFIKPVDDGPLDINLKAGDIVFAKDDAAPLGSSEKQSWLIAKIDDPVDAEGTPFPPATQLTIRQDLQSQEYGVGPTPDTNLVRRERKHAVVNYQAKLSPAEQVIVADGNQMLPDGDTAFGGSVTDGVVSNLFTFGDISRK